MNRFTIRDSNIEDLAEIKKILEDNGYAIHIIGPYMVIKKVEFSEKEGL
jgi:MoaA/NifB/PqqE/SkfB family radical SAM enzyme